MIVHYKDINTVLDAIDMIQPICQADRNMVNDLTMDRAGLLEFITVVLLDQ